MRVGIFDPYLDTLSGGEKYMLSIASCLSSEHEVYIFWDKEKEAEIRQNSHIKLGIDLWNIKFYPNIFDKDISVVSRFIESRKFDAIIYLSDGSIPFVGTKLYIHFQFPIEWVNGRSLKTHLKLLFVKKIFCNSYFTKHLIDRKLNVNSQVRYPPINIKKSNITKENIILHVGRLDVDRNESNYKKQDVMIRVFKKMMDEGLKDWIFILIIGIRNEDRDKLNKLKQTVKGYPIEIIENPPNKILWEKYSKAKIYWHATGFGEDLQKHPEKAEHFGISTVEAMGMGVVPVVINEGGQKEIVTDGKNGFFWDTIDELQIKTKKLIDNKKLLNDMAEQARMRAKDFSNAKFCQKIRQLIE